MKTHALRRMFIFIIILVMLSPLYAIADEESNSFLFRNIPWLSDVNLVQELLSTESDLEQTGSGIKENANIKGWSYYSTEAKSAGAELKYNAKVAGYSATLIVSFVYPLNNWEIDGDLSHAQFGKASYTLWSLESYSAAFDDLKNKLTILYGEPEIQSDTNLFTGTKSYEGSLWTAPDGSVIFLKKELNLFTGSISEIVLTYAAPDLDSKLYDIEHRKELKQKEEENKLREENTENFSGL